MATVSSAPLDESPAFAHIAALLSATAEHEGQVIIGVEVVMSDDGDAVYRIRPSYMCSRHYSDVSLYDYVVSPGPLVDGIAQGLHALNKHVAEVVFHCVGCGAGFDADAIAVSGLCADCGEPLRLVRRPPF